MTTNTQDRTKSGVLLPLLVDMALREVEKWKPQPGRTLRTYIERLMTGMEATTQVRLFPSAAAFVARAAVRGGTLSVGRNPTQRCRRCRQPAMALLVDGATVAFYDACEQHAQEGAGLPANTADSAVASY